MIATSPKPFLIEGGANRADAPVHHVRRRDDIGARSRMRQRLAHQQIQRGVVVDVVIPDHAAMPMVGVLAHANVGDHDQAGHALLDLANCALHLAVVIPRFGSGRVLVRRDAKQNDRRHAGGEGFARRGHHVIDRQLRDAGHRANRFGYAAAGAHEVGLDKIVGR